MATQFTRALQTLSRAGVDFILIGGVAGAAHGAPRTTLDLDAVYARNPENVDRLASALAPFHPYPRGAPPGLPFAFDSATIVRGLNFTLTTDLGALDLLGEVVGGGTYEELLPRTQLMEIHGVTCRCVDLPTLIHLKRAAGRPKDSEAVAELELILEQRRKITPAS
ncbi:MAG: hypothetical protein HUU25_06075 [Candidatus Sumerlaeia bacterium]|nr:hypothetical protein [Candidatus Sumerlaeia bacterium]